MTTIYTIGYEGASVDDFIATLRIAGVKCVMDVREVAQSRRAGFSKNGLAAALAATGIAYCHYRQLGDPKPGREAARQGKMDEFRAIFEKHLELPETVEALARAVETVAAQPTALMCFERDPKGCHRTLVAGRMTELCSLSVQHLGVVEHAAQRTSVIAKAA